jgi:hypothetical protein
MSPRLSTKSLLRTRRLSKIVLILSNVCSTSYRSQITP